MVDNTQPQGDANSRLLSQLPNQNGSGGFTHCDMLHTEQNALRHLNPAPSKSFYATCLPELTTRPFSVRSSHASIPYFPKVKDQDVTYIYDAVDSALRTASASLTRLNIDSTQKVITDSSPISKLADTITDCSTLSSRIADLEEIKTALGPRPIRSSINWHNYSGVANVDTPMAFANAPESFLDRTLSAIGRQAFIGFCVFSSYFFYSVGGFPVTGQDKIVDMIKNRPRKVASSSSSLPSPYSSSSVLLPTQRRPLLTVCNHTTTLDDPLAVAGVVPPFLLSTPSLTRWVVSAQDICFRSLAGYFFALCKCVPVERGSGVFQPSMGILSRLLSQGEWVHIFPEGRANFDPIYTGRDRETRDPLGLSPLRRGAATLAFHSALRGEDPVVLPYAHAGLSDAKPGGGFLPLLAGKPMKGAVGEPLEMGEVVNAYKTHLERYMSGESAYFPQQDDYIAKISNRIHVALQTLYDDMGEGRYTKDKDGKGGFWSTYLTQAAREIVEKRGKISNTEKQEQEIQQVLREITKERENAPPGRQRKLLYPSPRCWLDAPNADLEGDVQRKTTPLDLFQQMKVLEMLVARKEPNHFHNHKSQSIESAKPTGRDLTSERS